MTIFNCVKMINYKFTEIKYSSHFQTGMAMSGPKKSAFRDDLNSDNPQCMELLYRMYCLYCKTYMFCRSGDVRQ